MRTVLAVVLFLAACGGSDPSSPVAPRAQADVLATLRGGHEHHRTPACEAIPACVMPPDDAALIADLVAHQARIEEQLAALQLLCSTYPPAH